MHKGFLEKSKKHIDTGDMDSADLVKVFDALVTAKKEYEITREQEGTKRLAIEANLHKYITKVQETKELLANHLSEEYALRREVIEGIFERLDRALDEDKDTIVVSALNALEGVIKESPLKEVDKIGKAFEDDSELEI